ncbi:peptidase C14, caspase domain-containing protein [Cladochytrium replicatum]|nr:peptidase C14, caspase domain-containing protein [Cladochytrium replicatum]
MNFLNQLAKEGGIGEAATNFLADKIAGSHGGGDDAVTSNPSSLPGYQSHSPQITGKRRALFIGINYVGTKAELKGCVNDVKNVHAFVTKQPYQEALILTDDQQDPSKIPTRANILNAFRWLIAGAQPGDAFFLHYSGHGAYQQDPQGDEVDGSDETIVPLDYESAGMIVDDDMHQILVGNLPAGSCFTAIFDCCHSGSVMDLPYTYRLDGNLDVVVIDNKKAAVKMGLKAGLNYLRGDKQTALNAAKEAFGMYMKKPGHSDAVDRTRKANTTQAFVVQFSGCLDSQTSADAQIQGSASGALSWAMMSVLNQNPHITYIKLLKEVRELLHGKYSQIPQISTGFPISLDIPFNI